MAYEDETVAKAREIARNCPTGYLVVHDTQTSRVFYRDTNSPKAIPTDFTEEHIFVAHSFKMHDPDHLEWDMGNNSVKPSYKAYKISGK